MLSGGSGVFLFKGERGGCCTARAKPQVDLPLHELKPKKRRKRRRPSAICMTIFFAGIAETSSQMHQQPLAYIRLFLFCYFVCFFVSK